MDNDFITNLVTVLVPVFTTIATHLKTEQSARKNAAKQSILQMIMEDKIAWIIDKEFPTNYGRVIDNYAIYHKNGGNGEVTKKVEEYKKWYYEIEDSLKNK